MKKLVITLLCMFFLFALIALAQNETGNNTLPSQNDTISAVQTQTGAPAQGGARAAAQNATAENISSVARQNASGRAAPPAPRTARQTPAVQDKCGNKVQDAGETCFSCPSDVRCKSGEMCDEKGECVKQASFTVYIIVGIGVFVLLGLFFVAKRLTKKPEEPLRKPEFIQQKPAQQPIQPWPVQQPQEPVQKPVQPAQQPQAAATVGSAATLMSKPQEAPAKEEPAQEEVVDEHKGETQIQQFIRQRRESGWTDEQIRQKMKESGWKDTQIALEFLKAPKFVKNH